MPTMLFVTAVLAFIALSSCRAEQQSWSHLWREAEKADARDWGVVEETDVATISFRIFLALRTSPSRWPSLQSQQKSTCATINECLDVQRALYGPSEMHFLKIEEWMWNRAKISSSPPSKSRRSSGKDDGSCTRHWDHLECVHVKVHQAERLFQTKLTRVVPTIVRQSQEGSLLLSLEKSTQDLREWIHKETGVAATTVFGIAAHKPLASPPRLKPHFRRLDADAGKDAQGRGIGREEEAAGANDADNDAAAAESRLHNWPMLNTTTDPVILSVYSGRQSIHSVSVALKCANKVPGSGGLPSAPARLEGTANHSNVPAEWCDGTSTFSPAKIVFTVVNSDTGVRYSSQTYNFSNGHDTYCAAANSSTAWRWQFIANPNSTLTSNVVCLVNVSGDFGAPTFLDLGYRYTVEARVEYEDGSKSHRSQYRNFYNDQFFTDPAHYSTDKGLVSFIGHQPAYPNDIQDRYNVPLPPGGGDWFERARRSVAQGVVEFSDTTDPGKGFLTTDLATFFTNLSIPYANVSRDLHVINGLSNVYQDETSLDMELIMSIAPGVKTYLYNVVYGANTSCVGYDCAFLAFLSDIASSGGSVHQQPASVWSISYGGPEDGMPVQQLEAYFALLSRAGVSVVASTGDGGAGWDLDNPLVAMFPSSAPSVVGAGGTAFHVDTGRPNGGFDRIEEIACSDADFNIITTGGGFSENYPIRLHQRDVVQQYLDAQRAAHATWGDTDPSLLDKQFVAGKVGVPDVSALAANILTIIGGERLLMYGTSASAPITAALLTRINLERVTSNMTSLPLVNQFLYHAKQNRSGAMVDVVKGSNCAGEYDGPLGGFLFTFNDSLCYNASSGWDAATGLGTIHYPDLLAVALEWNPALPGGGGAPSSSWKWGLAFAACAVVGVAALGLAWHSLRKNARPRHGLADLDRDSARNSTQLRGPNSNNNLSQPLQPSNLYSE